MQPIHAHLVAIKHKLYAMLCRLKSPAGITRLQTQLSKTYHARDNRCSRRKTARCTQRHMHSARGDVMQVERACAEGRVDVVVVQHGTHTLFTTPHYDTTQKYGRAGSAVAVIAAAAAVSDTYAPSS